MERNKIPEIIDNLIIIPDTNILLYLYKCSFNTSQNIVELLKKVKDKVIVPRRVYSEYSLHKKEEQSKIDRKYDNFTKDLKNQVKEVRGKITGCISESRKYDFPDCDSLQTSINTTLDEAIDVISTYESSLSSEKQNKSTQIANVEQLIEFWTQQGKVLEEPNMLQILEYVKEGEFRYRYKMPPGYMDEEEKDKQAAKQDNFENRIRKYGDLFVWKEIIKVGKNAQENAMVLFLTNDVKEDWWVTKGEQKEAVCMRNELLKEYTAETGKEKIEFMTLSQFYELFSHYYEICDIKTTLELDYDSYIRGLISSKYSNEIELELLNKVSGIEWDDIDSDFMLIKPPEVDFDEVVLDEVTLHFDNDGESAFYEVKVSVNTFPIHINEYEQDTESRIADVELQLKLTFQVQRDLFNLDEDGISFKEFSYEVISNRDAWDVYQELELDAKAETDDAIENYYNH